MAFDLHTECTKKWKLDDLGLIIDSAENYVLEGMRKQQVKTAHDYLNILLFAFGKSTLTMREIICLCTFGFPDGALALARSLYEQFITVAYFELHNKDSDFQNYVDDYFVDYAIQRNRALKYEAMHFNNDADLKVIEEETARLKATTYHNITNQDFWWTGKGSFANVSEEILNSQGDLAIKTFLARLHFTYKRACAAIHASCLGNVLRLGVDSNYVGIDNSAKIRGHELPLYLAVCSYILIISTTCRQTGLDDKYMNKELNELAAFYLKANQDDSPNK